MVNRYNDLAALILLGGVLLLIQDSSNGVGLGLVLVGTCWILLNFNTDPDKQQLGSKETRKEMEDDS